MTEQLQRRKKVLVISAAGILTVATLFGIHKFNKNDFETALGIVNNIDKQTLTYENIYDLVNKNRSKKINVKMSTRVGPIK